MAVQELIGKEQWSSNEQNTQVYQATHDGGGKRLPYMGKSFISFSYGGKFIEDFGLVVVTNDRLNRGFYSEFNDVVTEHEVVDGQLYWGTRLSPNKIELTLATDGMTEKQIDNFREWFTPGCAREFILSEHPNRAIIARVSEVPQYSFIPFEKISTITINNIEYETSSTVYRGEVTLILVMDDPYWYSKLNYMPTYVNRITLEELDINSINSNKITTLGNKDMLKIMLEDGIPHQSILDGTMFLGGNHLVTSTARVGFAEVNNSYLGVITGESEGLDVNSTPQYLFYSGTAKSYPEIKFSMNLIFNSSGYIVHPIGNPTNKIVNTNLLEYSYIKIGNRYFLFTTPSILTGYNQAIKIFEDGNANGISIADIKTLIREKVNEYYSRAFAMQCISASDATASSALTAMKTFIATQTENGVTTSVNKATFIFNSKTGKAEGIFNVKVNNAYEQVVENVGDMVRSDYLIIEGRDYLNSNGMITTQNCHKITSNESLSNVLVFYKNMYL